MSCSSTVLEHDSRVYSPNSQLVGYGTVPGSSSDDLPDRHFDKTQSLISEHDKAMVIQPVQRGLAHWSNSVYKYVLAMDAVYI